MSAAIGLIAVWLGGFACSAGSAAESLDASFEAADQSARFGDCYASWDATSIVVGNSQFERRWRVIGNQLLPSAWVTKSTQTSWIAEPNASKSGPAFELRVTGEVDRYSPVSDPMLTLQIAAGESAPAIKIQVFSNASGVLITRLVEDMKAFDCVHRVRLAPRHLRVREVKLVDQTDKHDELVFENERLLSPIDGRVVSNGVLMLVEDSLTGQGIALLKLAPLPHARPDTQGNDFRIDGRSRTLDLANDAYPVAIINYDSPGADQVASLQRAQRCLRPYVPERDSRFLSNTWGDRSRDARINARFIRQEIAAANRLGVEVLQIDDGWQKGRSKNSAYVKDRSKGVWNGFWEADPNFWDSDPERFPEGLQPLAQEAAKAGVRLGLWYAPDSNKGLANWRRDADRLLELHNKVGIDYFKIDAIKLTSAESVANQRRLFDRVLQESGGQVSFDLDVTAELRPGYFGAPHVGPLFVENRYTDSGTYWPHHTLRNLWRLSNYIDPLRLRMELLNVDRNADRYGDDPLAPSRYRYDTLFAMTMMANPLGWFEVSNLPDRAFDQLPPLVSVWKKERRELHSGIKIPIGSPPDGVAWTGFVSRNSAEPTHATATVLLFRELNDSSVYHLPLETVFGSRPEGDPPIRLLAGRGSASISGEHLVVTIPEKLDYVWLRLGPKALEP